MEEWKDMNDETKIPLMEQVATFERMSSEEWLEKQKAKEKKEVDKLVQVELRVQQEREKQVSAVKERGKRQTLHAENQQAVGQDGVSEDKQRAIPYKRRPNGVVQRGRPLQGNYGRMDVGVVKRRQRHEAKEAPAVKELTVQEKEEKMLHKLMGLEANEEEKQISEESSKEIEISKEEKMMRYILRRK